jgi:hypothetical protein
VFPAVSFGGELFLGWDELDNSGSMSATNSYFHRSTSSVTTSAVLANATASWPSAFSGIYATAQAGVASVAINSTVMVTNTSHETWFADTRDTNSWHLLSGVSAGARYTFPFGIGIGIEESLKGLASEPAQARYAASESSSKPNPGSFTYTGPTSDAIMSRIGISYQFLLSYSF